MDAKVLLTWPQHKKTFNLWDSTTTFNDEFSEAICIWDLAKKQLKQRICTDSKFRYVSLAPDGRTLALAENDQIRLWDIEMASYVQSIRCSTSDTKILNFTAESSFLLFMDADRLSILDINSETILTYPETLRLHDNKAILFPDGDRVVFEKEDHSLQIWTIPMRKTSNDTTVVNNNTKAHAAISRDQTVIAIASARGLTHVLRTEHGEQAIELHKHKVEILRLALSNNNLVLASAYKDQTLRLWDIQTGECLHVFDVKGDRLCLLEFIRQDSRLLAMFESRVHDSLCSKLYVWDLETFQCLLLDDGKLQPSFCLIKVSQDESLLMCCYQDMLQVFDTSTGNRKFSNSGFHSSIYYAKFSNNGRQVAFCEIDGLISILESQSGQQLHSIMMQRRTGLFFLAFSPNDALLAIYNLEGLLMIWDIASSLCQCAIEIAKPLKNVQISPSGAWLITAGQHHPTLYEVRDDLKDVAGNDVVPTHCQLTTKDVPKGRPISDIGGTHHSQLNKTFSETDPDWVYDKYSYSGGWVYYLDQKILWLSPEFRPMLMSAQGNKLVMCSHIGFVTVVEEESEPPKYIEEIR